MDHLPPDLSHLLLVAVQAAADGIVITDRDGTIVWANTAAQNLTGYTSEELIGNNPRVLKSNQMDDALYKKLWETILRGEVWHGELINKRKDHSLYQEEMTITPVKSQSGEITHFIAIKHDITKRKQTYNQLKVSEERYRTIFDVSPELIMLIDLSGNVMEVNKKVTDWLGYEVSEVKGLSVTQLPYLSLPNKLKVGALFAARIAGKAIESYSLDVIHKDGTKRVGQITGELIRDANGKIVADLVIASDITNQIENETRLKQRTSDLERLNSLMVGRELKMIELKKEIETLKMKISKGG